MMGMRSSLELLAVVGVLFFVALVDANLHEHTEDEAAVKARALVASEGVGFIGSVMSSPPNAYDNGYAYASMDYFVDQCVDESLQSSNGSPLLLLSTLEVATQNILKNNRISLAIRSKSGASHNDGSERWNKATDEERAYAEKLVRLAGPAALTSRMTLLGTISGLNTLEENDVATKCFLARHPDAKMWIKFADFSFYRLDVEHIYWVGGFGDSHYIGWIDRNKYYNASTLAETSPTSSV